MSFSDNYYALLEEEKKKKKKEAAEQKTGHSFTDTYNELMADADIAPVKTVGTDAPLFANRAVPFFERELSLPVKKPVTTKKSEKEDDRKWFEKGLFEDGWDKGDLWKTILGTATDIRENLGAGIIGMGEKALDALAYAAPLITQGQFYQNGGVYQPPEVQKALEESVAAGKQWSEDFIKQDLYDEGKVAKKLIRGTDEHSMLGEKSDALLQSGGQLLGTAGLQAVGVPWFVTTGATAFGSEAETALNEGATYEQAGLSATISAGAEILTEKLGGIAFGGGSLTDAGIKKLSTVVSGKFANALLKAGKFTVNGFAEGGEELLSGYIDAFGKKLTYMSDAEINDIFGSEDRLESFIGGFVLGEIGEVGDAVKSARTGTDYVTGLTKNEKKVVDHIYETEIAKAEADGKKMTAREKSKLHDAIVQNMEKGGISTDTIEEVLGGDEYTAYKGEYDAFFGGDTYKAYKDTITSEEAQIKELEAQIKALENEPDTIGNRNKYNALESQIEQLRNSAKQAELKAQLDSEAIRIGGIKNQLRTNVFEQVKDSRLAEGYRELERSKEQYTADLSKYDNEHARKTIQNIMDSGVANNTNEFHEFADWLAQISADKGMTFTGTDAERLKGTRYDIAGKQIHGFVDEDGNVTLNFEDHKGRLQTTVGHEIGHVLEGTEFYGELQSALKNYAISKMGLDAFNARLKETENRYKGIGDPDKELTADLIGEYIFTDTDFVRNLSVQHRNVFQKIYDEIKYLYKIATAGSKEARELEKVKRVFAEAYRAEKNTADYDSVKYNISRTKSMSWDEQINGALYNGKNIRRNDTLVVGIPTDTSVGNEIENKPLAIPLSVLTKASSGKDISHSIKKGKLAKLDEGIKNAPITIVNPDRNAVVYITNIKQGGLPVVVSFDMNANFDGDIVHKATSIHLQVDVKTMLENLPESATVYVQKNELDPVGATNNLRGLAAKIKFIDNNITQKNQNVKYSLTDNEGRKISPVVQKRFGNSKVVDENGSLKVVYHGTAAGEFSIFDKSKGSVEGDFGSGFYFTDNQADVSEHYEGGGPDFDNKVARLAEQIEVEEEIDYEEAEQKARDQLYKGSHLFEVYLNIENPAIVGETMLLDGESYMEQYDEDDFDDYDEYIEEVEQLVANDIENVVWEVERNVDVYSTDGIAEVLWDAYANGGMDIEEFKKRLNDLYLEDSNGNLVANEVARQIIESLGYDGIIDPTVSGKWNMNIEEGTTHYIVFKPNQIKAITNENPTDNPDIHRSLSDAGGEVDNHYNQKFRPTDYFKYSQTYGKDIALEAPVGESVAAPTYDAQAGKGVVDGQQTTFEEAPKQQSEEERKQTRKQLHQSIVDSIKSYFYANGLDLDKTLKDAKNLSTFATVDNIPQRVMEKALGYKAGQVLSELTVNKVAQNETEGIKWLNGLIETVRKISKQHGIRPGSKASAAAQMYAEGFYVDDKNNIVAYGDAELAKDFPNSRVQQNIKHLSNDPRIRQIYDETLDLINASRTRNAYPEIPRLENYYLHFRAMGDTFSRLGLPFNPNDIRAKDLPTDLNGVTADLKPGQPYFASAMHRTGKRTSFDLLGGLERYLNSAKNQIYHIDDIQTLRALRNYVADTYGQANGLEGLDALSEEEAQQRIEQVYNSHLSTFAKFLNEEANILAGKTALIDRGLEGIIGRRGITFLDTVNKQVGSNMVGFNISSSLTNFLPVAQTIAKTNKFDFVKAFAQTVGNKVGSVFGRTDGFAENSPVIIRRKGSDRFYRTPWQKAGDAGYVFMSAVDNISTELIARTKYNELTRKGMDAQKAHYETDKWVSRLMGDRSLGQMPQLYNSKMLGLVTKFQLEVRNQLDSQFYDTIQEAKVSSEHIENRLARNAKIAAKVASTFTQLAVVQHLFGKAFESVAGYNPAFDIISVLLKAFGYDDDEDSEDTALDNVEQAFLELLEDLPYTSTFTGGRIPISTALPIEELVTGEDEWGNEKSRLETLGEIAPYYVLPGGYGQIKKTTQGLDMFSDDHPVAGSYTDSGNLRFPVDDTLGNRIQAGIFGQWASENARTYFDNDLAPLDEKKTQEYAALGIPYEEYWAYRDDMSAIAKRVEEDGASHEDVVKSKYINSIDTELSEILAEKQKVMDDTELSDNAKAAKARELDRRFAELANVRHNTYNKVSFDGNYANIGNMYFHWYTPENGDPYWRKLTEDQKTKYLATRDVDGVYATNGTQHYRLNEGGDPENISDWTKLSDREVERQNEVTKQLGITPEEYWSKTEKSMFPMYEGEYEYAYDNPENYAVAKAVGGYDAYRGYSKDLYNIKADKDEYGKSISGSRKEKVLDYINNLDADYYTKIILWKSEYPSDDSYNNEIIEYLNGREDISFEETIAILRKLGFDVTDDGNISW